MKRLSLRASISAACLLGVGVAHAQPAPTVQTSPPAAAATPSEAQTRFQRGSELFNVRNYEGALVEFQRSYELSGHPGLLYNLGRTNQALGRYPEAARAIEEYLRRASDLTPERRAEVETMLTQTRAFIAHLDLRVLPADVRATIVLDGEALDATSFPDGIAVSPGRHTVEARAEGWETASVSGVVASGDRMEFRLLLERPRLAAAARARVLFGSLPTGAQATIDGEVVALPVADVRAGTHVVELRAPGYAPWRGEVTVTDGTTRTVTPRLASTRGLPVGWLLGGVSATAAFALAGAVFGGLTLSAHDEYVQYSREQAMLPEVVEIRDRGETMRLLSNVFFGLAGAAGVATVVIATQTRFQRASTAELSFAPSPAGASARLRVTF